MRERAWGLRHRGVIRRRLGIPPSPAGRRAMIVYRWIIVVSIAGQLLSTVVPM